MKTKKSVMGQIISVFVLVLVISILAGLTFLFVGELKDQVSDSSTWTTVNVHDENVTVNGDTYTLSNSSSGAFYGFAIGDVVIYNATKSLVAANYSVSSDGIITNLTSPRANGWEIAYAGWLADYNFSYISDPTAHRAVNDTENAGATIVNYLPLIFLALIFGAILTLVLKIILPFINLGQSIGDGGF